MQRTPRRPERPTLWILAGPNGSGKSSSYNRTDIEGWGGSVWIINPDLLTARLAEQEGMTLAAANLAALQRIEDWLQSSIAVHQTIGVETVLSSFKYRRLVRRAKAFGFRVRLIYVFLQTVELQRQRIALRVAEGGHDVPAGKVAERRLRSFRQLAWFCRHADDVAVIDNSSGEPELVATAHGESIAIERSKVPADMLAILTRLRIL